MKCINSNDFTIQGKPVKSITVLNVSTSVCVRVCVCVFICRKNKKKQDQKNPELAPDAAWGPPCSTVLHRARWRPAVLYANARVGHRVLCAGAAQWPVVAGGW